MGLKSLLRACLRPVVPQTEQRFLRKRFRKHTLVAVYILLATVWEVSTAAISQPISPVVNSVCLASRRSRHRTAARPSLTTSWLPWVLRICHLCFPCSISFRMEAATARLLSASRLRACADSTRRHLTSPEYG